MVLPEARTPLLHDPNGSGVIGRQGSESIDDHDGRAEVLLNQQKRLSALKFFSLEATKKFAGDLCSRRL